MSTVKFDKSLTQLRFIVFASIFRQILQSIMELRVFHFQLSHSLFKFVLDLGLVAFPKGWF